MRLDGIQDANEGGAEIIRPQMQRMGQFAAAAAFAPTPIQAGQLQITASVTIRYRLAPIR